MAELFSTAFANLMTGTNIFLMLVGVVVGIIFGCVPGLSAAMAIALFLPVTFGLPQYSAFALLMALYIGGVSGSLISAILINVPGSSQSIATCYDGHPMAVKGEAHRALGTGMLFSFIGTMFSLVILIFAAPVIADYAVKLGNFEFFSLVTFALVLIICICGGNIVKAILAGLLGMARRAGKVTAGFDAVVRLLKEGKAYLTLTAADLSDKTEKELRFAAGEKGGSRILRLGESKENLGHLLGYGRPVGVLAVSDKGFAASLRGALAAETPEEQQTRAAETGGDIQEGFAYDD